MKYVFYPMNRRYADGNTREYTHFMIWRRTRMIYRNSSMRAIGRGGIMPCWMKEMR